MDQVSLQLMLAAGLFIMASLMLILSVRTGVHASINGNPAGSRLRDASLRLLSSRGGSAWKRYQELSHRLRLAGYVGLRMHIIVILMAVFMVLMAALAGIAFAQTRSLTDEQASAQVFMSAVFFASTMTLILMYALRARIKSRTRQMEDGIEILLQLTRMLWSTGMTIEMQFRQLIVHLRDIAPHLSFEIGVALGRIESGQAREDVLEQLAKCQPYAGLSDYFRLLSQLSVSGGRAVQSLQILGDLLRDARRTRLQEALTRMSAKMSLIMMLCFFPALLVFLAGPALINISAMFSSMAR